MPFAVNGELIEESEIRKEAALLRPQFEQVMTDLDPVEAERQLWEWSRENVIEKALLRQEAVRSGLVVTEEEILHAIQAMRPYQAAEAGSDTEAGSDSFKRDVETQIRVERLLAKVAENAKTPDKKAVTEFYRKHREEFLTPETIQAAHIVKHVNEDATEEAAREGIAEAERRLAAGEDFATVADSVSDCPGRGGDLGTFGRGSMVEEFDEAVFALQPGQHSPVFRTVFGFHIARLIARHPEGIRPLNEVRGEIEQHLYEEARREEMERYVDALKEKADIRKVAAAG
ncbi:MAG: peptidylprolyl isomerase [Bryobacterales bacterium]|nr:peptidylprolyl isomerase [Bryobacterales bacterium]